MQPEVMFLVCLVWSGLGLFLSMLYFEDVQVTKHTYYYDRKLVPCDLIFALLFGPICWLFMVIAACTYLPSIVWLHPAEWAKWVGNNCAFSNRKKKK